MTVRSVSKGLASLLKLLERSTSSALWNNSNLLASGTLLDTPCNAIWHLLKKLDREINVVARAAEALPPPHTRKEWDGKVKLEQAFVMDILSSPKIFLIGDEDELRGAAQK